MFYPRYLELFDHLVEDWCRDQLHLAFSDLISTRQWALPIVHLSVDFIAPCFFGEKLTASLFVTSVGTSSINLEIALEDRVQGKLVLTLIDRHTRKSIPIPDDIRASLSECVD